MMFKDMSMVRREKSRTSRALIITLVILIFVFTGFALYFQSRIAALQEELDQIQPGSGVGMSVGAVDFQRIIEESPRAREYQERLDQKGLEIEQEFETRAQDMDEDEVHEYQQEAYDQYWEIREQLEAELNEEINEALVGVAEEMGLDIIMASQGLHLGGEDVTEQVLQRLQ